MATPKTDSAAIRTIIRALKANGYTLRSVDDGGELIKVRTETEALDAILAVDDAHLFVNRPGTDGGPWVRFVMGNEPCEVAADYAYSLSSIIESVTDGWDL